MRRAVALTDCRLAAVVAFSLGIGTVVLASTIAQAGASICQVNNQTTGAAPSADLQAVIDAASAGDTVRVEGTCFGNFTTDKDLTVVGHPTLASPSPTLDGSGIGTVLAVTGGPSVDVVVTDLTITHGVGSWTSGGGMSNGGSVLTLKGVSLITANTVVSAAPSAGIYNDGGTVTLEDSASVSGNLGEAIYNHAGALSLHNASSVSDNDGGILNYGVVTMSGVSSVTDNSGVGVVSSNTVTMRGSSSISGNRGGRGGGIYNNNGIVTMSDQSSVYGNHAHHRGGGIYIDGRVKKLRYGTVVLNDSASVYGNSAHRGAGIYIDRYELTLNGSASVVQNVASIRGGGIINHNGEVTLNDSAIVRHNTPDNCVRC